MSRFKLSGRCKDSDHKLYCSGCKQNGHNYYYTLVRWGDPWDPSLNRTWFVCSITCANQLMLMVM